ncbi:unnamed protein product [Staurois parvus]|uniref:Uncharacterized protein n=1 Tax=Staurois parvus TaxID=386267 RepID=A0ABN9DXS7_9NEOB|nr:unnamed protein product [Staurois parvus]
MRFPSKKKKKIYKLNDDMACSVAGIPSDINILTNELWFVTQQKKQYWGFHLYQNNPRGNLRGWNATCICNNSAAAVSMLKQDYRTKGNILQLTACWQQGWMVHLYSPPIRQCRSPMQLLFIYTFIYIFFECIYIKLCFMISGLIVKSLVIVIPVYVPLLRLSIIQVIIGVPFEG